MQKHFQTDTPRLHPENINPILRQPMRSHNEDLARVQQEEIRKIAEEEEKDHYVEAGSPREKPTHPMMSFIQRIKDKFVSHERKV